MKALASLAQRNGVRLAVMTQPNAYRSDYRPYREDLRAFPVIGGKRASAAQASKLLQAFNDQTRTTALRLGLGLIDADRCLRSRNPSPLFYDAVHPTPEGNAAIADCIRAARWP